MAQVEGVEVVKHEDNYREAKSGEYFEILIHELKPVKCQQMSVTDGWLFFSDDKGTWWEVPVSALIAIKIVGTVVAKDPFYPTGEDM